MQPVDIVKKVELPSYQKTRIFSDKIWFQIIDDSKWPIKQLPPQNKIFMNIREGQDETT